jgi:hypothetical protein
MKRKMYLAFLETDACWGASANTEACGGTTAPTRESAIMIAMTPKKMRVTLFLFIIIFS